MPRYSVRDLLTIELRLNRSFYAAVSSCVLFIVLAQVFGPTFLQPAGNKGSLTLAMFVCLLLAIAGYIWYVISIYQTSKAIHKPNGLFLLWAIWGPVLSQIIRLPFISVALAVTSLLIKFFLSNKLQAMTRLQELRDRHS
jgi:hypothetical protein